MRAALALLVGTLACGASLPAVDGGADAAPPPAADLSFDLAAAALGPSINPALLGQYDLSGALFSYHQRGLAALAKEAGMTEWRVGVGRWELGTQLFPSLTDGTPCDLAGLPAEALAKAGDLELIRERDWFTYTDGAPVTAPMTTDDSRYALGYARAVLDVARALGAEPWVNIDSMPRALSANKTPSRTTAYTSDACLASFTNRVSNVKPADVEVFARAATGMIQRLLEGSGGEPGRPFRYVEIWNEPDDGPYFWDKTTSSFDDWTKMALVTLAHLEQYRSASKKELKLGLGSFVHAEIAAKILEALDADPVVKPDFFSFHSYDDDPLAIVANIAKVDAARRASKNFKDAEIALAEWGPRLQGSKLDPRSLDVALHPATVLVLGAARGLDHAHHAIFWDFYPIIQLGLVDHAGKPKPLHMAYALLAQAITGARRVLLPGHEDGRLWAR